MYICSSKYYWKTDVFFFFFLLWTKIGILPKFCIFTFHQICIAHLYAWSHLKNQSKSTSLYLYYHTFCAIILSTLFNFFTPSTAERKEFMLDFAKTLVEANIPIEKAPKLADFLQKYCKQGGSIPALFHFRSKYQPDTPGTSYSQQLLCPLNNDKVW
uniref:Uncharacterized protein n=1 Tax=Echeneis naucrates TaxID=173247 RepID=A0A665TKM1_ECHNA